MTFYARGLRYQAKEVIGVYNIEVRRPRIEDAKEMNQFFSKVIKDTFAVEGLSGMQDAIRDEIEYKNQYLNWDIDSNGEIRFFG